MNARLSQQVRRHATGIRRVADVLLVGILSTLIAAVVLNQVRPVQVRIDSIVWVAVVFVVLLTARLGLQLIVWRLTEPVGGVCGSLDKLVESLPTPVPTLIARADQIQILGGTLIELVRQTPTLEALAIASSRGVKIKIIMIDPNAAILNTIAKERVETGEETVDGAQERLKGECEYSIGQLRYHLPRHATKSGLRLSSTMPHHAFQRYGDCYLVTAYTFGHGGRSPSMFIARSSTNEELCDGLSRGFDDLWESNFVRPV